jgi:hypothetical protein
MTIAIRWAPRVGGGRGDVGAAGAAGAAPLAHHGGVLHGHWARGAAAAARGPQGKGLHPSTFQLNLSHI